MDNNIHWRKTMENFMAFLSQFCSYLILMLVIIVVATLGFIVGSIIRKGLEKKKGTEAVDAAKTEKEA